MRRPRPSGAAVCNGEIGPGNLHPCKPNYDGRYYSLSVVSFSPTHGTVAIHTGEGGTRVMELERERIGWKVVDSHSIAS